MTFTTYIYVTTLIHIAIFIQTATAIGRSRTSQSSSSLRSIIFNVRATGSIDECAETIASQQRDDSSKEYDVHYLGLQRWMDDVLGNRLHSLSAIPYIEIVAHEGVDKLAFHLCANALCRHITRDIHLKALGTCVLSPASTICGISAWDWNETQDSDTCACTVQHRVEIDGFVGAAPEPETEQHIDGFVCAAPEPEKEQHQAWLAESRRALHQPHSISGQASVKTISTQQTIAPAICTPRPPTPSITGWSEIDGDCGRPPKRICFPGTAGASGDEMQADWDALAALVAERRYSRGSAWSSGDKMKTDWDALVADTDCDDTQNMPNQWARTLPADVFDPMVASRASRPGVGGSSRKSICKRKRMAHTSPDIHGCAQHMEQPPPTACAADSRSGGTPLRSSMRNTAVKKEGKRVGFSDAVEYVQVLPRARLLFY